MTWVFSPEKLNSRPGRSHIGRENLKRLLRYRGSLTALSLKLGCSPANVGHMIRHPSKPTARQIPEDTGRAIEKALGLDNGQLDWPDGRRPGQSPMMADRERLASALRAALKAVDPEAAGSTIDKVAKLTFYEYFRSHNAK